MTSQLKQQQHHWLHYSSSINSINSINHQSTQSIINQSSITSSIIRSKKKNFIQSIQSHSINSINSIQYIQSINSIHSINTLYPKYPKIAKNPQKVEKRVPKGEAKKAYFDPRGKNRKKTQKRALQQHFFAFFHHFLPKKPLIFKKQIKIQKKNSFKTWFKPQFIPN